MQWRAGLSGNPSDLMILHQALTKGEIVVEREGVSFWLAGSALTGLPNAQEAHELGKGLLALINGVGRVLDPLLVPVSLSGQVSDGGPSITVFAGVHMSGRGRLSLGQEPMIAARVTNRAADDDSYAEVIHLVGNAVDLNWFVLYKIYELLRAQAGGEQEFRQRAGVYKDDLSAFTGSANSRSVSGWDARHAVDQSTKPPRHTMSIQEAQILILGIVRDW